jgi:hypothetical protein
MSLNSAVSPQDAVSSFKKGKSIDDVYSLMEELKTELKQTEKHLGDSIEKLFERLDESYKCIEAQSKRLDECNEQICVLKSENTQLKKELTALSSRSDDLEQRTLSNNVEIHGVPFQKTENLAAVVSQIGHQLGIDLSEKTIDHCYRARPKPNGSPGGIIVRFTTQSTKENLLAKRRVKRNFSTRHLYPDSLSDDPIYINEALCPGRRRLLNAAKELKKEKKYAYLWIRGGRILMRKAEKEQVIVISSFEDLGNL